MALELYRRKRNFKTTPEPAGKLAGSRRKGWSFVIQKHAASHLHYDFRLELNGVLLSWAVPKGPSLDPNDKRLAMHVEDHPIEYGGFEGVIPPKQYGSGTVMVWDRGTWTPKGDAVEDYEKGKLKFELDGEKLKGGWMLVKSRGGKYGGDKAWLLIKEDDEYARRAPDALVVDDQPSSVVSGRSLEEIAADQDRVWHSNKSVADNVKGGAVRKKKTSSAPALAKIKDAVRAALPALITPQLATLVKEVPAGAEWVHEMKYDGYRMLCRIEDGEARMYSRTGKEWTANFNTIARAASRLGVTSAWLDGEVVVMQADGRSSFQALQNALSVDNAARFHYYLFDLPYLDGYDLTGVPLLERKRLLEKLLAPAKGMLRYSAHVEGSGTEFYHGACRLQLEGIISKRADSGYQAGRNRSWVKVKCAMRQEMVIGGYTDPEGSRKGLGALLLGVYEDGELRYSGKVGTGFDDATLKALRVRLDKLTQDKPPFANPPRGAEVRRAHWVKPRLVAEIAFTEWTSDGTLRHPSFQGLREDKKAAEVVREWPEPAPAAGENSAPPPKAAGKTKAAPGKAPKKTRSADQEGPRVAGITLSSPDKLLYPEAGVTKLSLAQYYEAVGEWILPHLVNRPLSLVRCPNGWDKQCFYQKNADAHVHQDIKRVAVETSDGPAQYMMANSTSALAALVQMGVLELHPWGSRSPKLGFPDRIVFDFDPDDAVGWSEIVEAARLVRTLLDEIGLRSFLKTTGGKGLHVVVPIQPSLSWDAIKGFSRAIAQLLSRTFPDRFTDKITRRSRRGRIFIDYLRNAEGSTAVSAYSPRARAKAPVATPIAWDETSIDVRFDYFNVLNVPARLKKLKADPWKEFFKVRQSVTRTIMKKVGYTES
jgi:bifunctional non-homologous end joining protein LigD